MTSIIHPIAPFNRYIPVTLSRLIEEVQGIMVDELRTIKGTMMKATSSLASILAFALVKGARRCAWFACAVDNLAEHRRPLARRPDVGQEILVRHHRHDVPAQPVAVLVGGHRQLAPLAAFEGELLDVGAAGDRVLLHILEQVRGALLHDVAEEEQRDELPRAARARVQAEEVRRAAALALDERPGLHHRVYAERTHGL